jgi:hypothetical protein
MIITLSSSYRAPVRLVNSTGSGVTGLTSSSVSVYLQKAGGSSYSKTLSGANWFEIDATHMPGFYDVLLTSSDTDTLGTLKYFVSGSGAVSFAGVGDVVAASSTGSSTTIITTSGGSRGGNSSGMDIKQGRAFNVPIRMLNLSGLALTGISYADVTCSIQKQGELPVSKSLTLTDWTEIDANRFPGLYDLTLHSTDLDRVGFLKFSANTSTSTLYVGVVGVVKYTTADVVDILGEPITTIARDLIETGRIVTDTRVGLKKKRNIPG